MSYLKHRSQKPIPTAEHPAERKARIQWLLDHDIWKRPQGDNNFLMGELTECTDFEYVYVNPLTEIIDDDDSLNTAFRIWVEAGHWGNESDGPNAEALVPPEGWNHYNRWFVLYDTRLSCGAKTMEDCLLKLASLVETFYDENGKDRVGDYWWCKDSCIAVDGGDFCNYCGFVVKEGEE